VYIILIKHFHQDFFGLSQQKTKLSFSPK